MPFDWRVYGPDTVLARVDKSRLGGFAGSLVVEPYEAAILLRDGEVTDVVSQGRFHLLGPLDVTRRVLGVGPRAEAIFASTAPFQLTYYVGQPADRQAQSSDEPQKGDRLRLTVPQAAAHEASEVSFPALTKDHQVVNAEISFSLRIDLDAAEQALQLLQGRRAIASWDIAQRIKSQFVSNVLTLELGKYTADEIRTDRSVLRGVNEAIRREMESGLRNLGLVLDGGVSIQWGLNETEQAKKTDYGWIWGIVIVAIVITLIVIGNSK